MAGDVEKRITAKYILDDSGFNEKLQGVNQQLKLNQSELKNAQVGMQSFGKNSDSLKTVQQALANQIETQSKKVDIYRQSIEKVSTKMQQNISQRDKLKTQLDQEQSKLNGAIQAYGKESQVTQNVSARVKELTEEYNSKQKAVESNARSITTYTTNLNRADTQLSKLQGQLNKTTEELNRSNSKWLEASEKLEVGSKSFKSVGEGANNAGNKILGITAPLVGVGVAAAKVGMDFDSQMSRVKAISGATGDEFQKLRSQAMQLGADTAFSSKEAAEGMENLASAGFNTSEIMEAMPGMLDLAASSGEDLATSADIAASTLRGFGIEANQAGHVADVLAKNAADTNAAVADTGEAMKYIAPVAHSMGISLEETTAAIGLMANAGIKGSQAGTTLRGALTRLASPSKEAAGWMKEIGFNAFDSHGKMLPLNEIIGRLQKSTAKLTDQKKQDAIATIFGQEAMSGMISLVQAGPEQLNNLTKSLQNSNGAAKDMANTMQDNAKASIEQMMGSLETAGIKLADNFAPTIRSVAETIGNLADKFGNLDPETQKLIVNGVLATAALGGTLKVVGGLAGGIGNILGLLGKFSGSIGTAKVAAQGATMAAGAAAEATAGVGAAAAGATAGAGGLAAGLGGLAIAAAPWLLAGAAVVGTGVLIHHELTKEATPAVDLFADKVTTTSKTVTDSYGMMTTQIEANTTKISDSTKKTVGAYIKLDDDVKKSLTNVYVNSDQFSEQSKNTVITKFTEMTNKTTGLNNDMKEQSLNNFKEMVANTTNLTDQNKAVITQKYSEMVNNVKGLSEQQKQKVINDFQQTMIQSQGITQQQTTSIVEKFNQMGTQIKAGMDKHYNDEYGALQGFFNKSTVLTQQEEANALAKLNADNNNKKATIDNYEKQIQDIMQNAVNNHRAWTEQDQQQVNAIQAKMRDTAIHTLSDNEVQAKVIMERMKDYGTRITSEQASSIIKNANSQRDGAVKSANEQCDKLIAAIIRGRDESHIYTADQANKLIADAKRQRDDTVTHAEGMRNDVVKKVSSMNSDVSKNVDTTTGNIKTNGQKIMDWWDKWKPSVKNFLFTMAQNVVTGMAGGTPTITARATGDRNYVGGLTTLHEKGYEVYNLPRGSRIYNHEASEDLVTKTAESVASKVATNVLGNSGTNTQSTLGDLQLIMPIYLGGNKIYTHTDKIQGSTLKKGYRNGGL